MNSNFSILAISVIGLVLAGCSKQDTSDSPISTPPVSQSASFDFANIHAIFAKAKEAAENGNVNFCGFYTGMSKADADALIAHYGLEDDEWTLSGDPIYSIHFSLKGVRRVTKDGNTFEELAQAVANRVGDLKIDYFGEYRHETIDGIVATISKSRGFNLLDQPAENRVRVEREMAELKAREEARKEAQKKTRKEMQKKVYAAARSWKPEWETIPLTESISVELKSVSSGLWFGKYEVTQGLWKAVMGNNPSKFKGADLPVEYVS